MWACSNRITSGVFVTVVLVAVTSFASAETITGKVARLYANGSTLNFRLHNDTCNLVSSNEYYRFTLESEVSKYWSAMLLAAATSGKEVRVKVSACSSDGNPVGSKQIEYLYQDF